MTVISTATGLSQAFKNAGRVKEIVAVFVKHGYADMIDRMRLGSFLRTRKSPDSPTAQLPPPVRLRMSFEELGPTFIKLGQLLATRPDLIPEAYVEEFEKLQDKVSNVPFSEIKTILESELKLPIEAVFESLDEIPIAAASIAQVHGATLKTGERVALKIQRPGIERIITNDVSILRGLALALEKYVPESRPMNPVGLVEEFFKSILFELDFLVEANNIRRIRNNLSDLDQVAIPLVYSKFSTGKVLVQERFDGVKFTDRDGIVAKGIDPAEIVKTGADAFFHMVIKDGLFHGDLHGGNLFVLNDGRIGIIDFGIVGRLSRRVKDSVIIMFTAIIDEDFDTLASEYMNLCQITGPSDFSALQKDLMDTISPYVGMALGEVNIGQILLRSTSIASRHHLRVPRELMLLFRALLTIEALGKRLDPTFDLLPLGIKLARQTIATRYSRERVVSDLLIMGRDLQGLLETSPRLLKRFLNRFSQNNFAFEIRNRDVSELANSMRRAAQAAAQISLAFVFAGIGMAGLIKDIGPEFLGLPLLATIPFTLSVMILLGISWKLRKLTK